MPTSTRHIEPLLPPTPITFGTGRRRSPVGLVRRRRLTPFVPAQVTLPFIVQETIAQVGANSTSIVISVPATRVGNLLMVAVVTNGVTSITDTGGNTWARVAIATPAGGVPVEWWRTTNLSPASVTSVTVNFPTSTPVAYFVEVQGAEMTAPIDAVNTSTATGTTAGTTGSAQPSTTNDLTLAAIGWYRTSGTAPDTGAAMTSGLDYTRIFAISTVVATSVKLSVGRRTGTPLVAQTYTTTLAAGDPTAGFAGLIVLIRPANPPIKFEARRPPRVRNVGPPRRTRRSEVVPAQQAVAAPTFVSDPRNPRRLRGLSVRRARPIETVPVQLNPPMPCAELVQPKRLRGLLSRRGRRVEVVSPQELISSPPPKSLARRVIVRSRRPRVEVVPTVTGVVQSPDVMWSPFRVARRALVRRPRARVEVVPAQLNPPIVLPTVVQPRRARGLLARRARRVEAVIAQDVPLASPPGLAKRRVLRVRRARPVETPLAQPGPVAEVVQPRRLHGFLRRKSMRIDVVPTQTTVVQSPDVMWSPTRPPRRALVRRARARVEAPLTQAAPVQSPDVMWSPTRTQRRALLRRPRARVEAPLTQAAPVADPSVMWSPTRVPRRALVRRARARVEPVPAQLNPPFPHAAIRQPRRPRGLQPRRRARAETYPPKRIYFPKIRLF